MERPGHPTPQQPLRTPVRRALTFVAVTALAAPLTAQTAPAAGSLPDLLTRSGIRPIQPPAAASDFTLPDLAGGQTSLSDYYGSWVVLTFFATWCGPCRSELPTLEKLHRERAEKGVVVLGVSVDDDREPLDPFVRQLNLTFPIVWDSGKQVGAAYRASSIPVSYLVDPRGRLAGVSRGARDWSRLAPMMDAALAAVPATLTMGPLPPHADAYAAAGEPVAMPQVSDPPSAELVLGTETPRAGEPFHLDVKVHWAGNFEEYLPHPPEIQLPEGVVRESVTAESSSRDGRNQLTYRLTLRADAPGRYALDPVDLRYTPRFETTPVASRVPGPTVEVQERTVLGLRPRTLAVGSAALALIGLAGWGLGRKLGRTAPRVSPAGELYGQLRAQFEEARKKRLAGDGAGCLVALAELDGKLRRAHGEPPANEAAEADEKTLKEAVEGARYGGEVPPAEQLDAVQRKVERRIEALRPDPGQAERKALKLRDSETA